VKSSFLPFSKPSISESEIKAVTAVLRSGWITTGPKAAEFEEAFRGYCDAAGAVALCSATGGMHLLFAALGISPGDEVITPSMTWVSTVNLVVLAGATPVFADIDHDSLMVSAETIQPLITDRTRLIIPVPIWPAHLHVHVSAAFALIAAVISVKWMLNYLSRHGLEIFGYYRVIVSVTIKKGHPHDK
jgi:dTDP-4-amino-4,6-dideoxygalactose transaminase